MRSPVNRRTVIGIAAAVVLALPVGAGAPAGAAPSGTSSRPGAPTLARTDSGLLRGTDAGDHHAFLGIPYAAPPVGPLRWHSPAPPARWSGVRDATTFGSPCPQVSQPTSPLGSTDEDCLYLNVYTPAHAHPRPGHGLPVMVWLYGGGYYSGAGSEYDPARAVVQGNVIVVTLNYRLGVLGYLAHAALDSPGHTSGDYGLEDQQAALRWVRHNSRAFGGDSSNVTLFGQSAGGAGTCGQLVSPAATGLFQRAIVQSGICDPASWWTPQRTAEAQGAAKAASLGCTDRRTVVACMRALPVTDLLNTDESYRPASGGTVVPMIPREAVTTGRFNHVPLLIGNVADEERRFVVAQRDWSPAGPLTAAEYPDALRGTYGSYAAAVLREYPLSRYQTPDLAWSTAQTDFGQPVSVCSTLDFVSQAARRVPVYSYEFADSKAPLPPIGPLPPMPGFPDGLGAAHSLDIQYVISVFGKSAFTPAQQTLSDQMIGYWTRFARTADPNGSEATAWPRFRHIGDSLQLAPGPGGIHTADLKAKHNCAFFSSLGLLPSF